jgi:hypothetical protein
VAARKRTKRAAHSLSVCFYRARKGRGGFGRKQWPLMAKAVGGFKTFKRRGLDGGVTVGN